MDVNLPQESARVKACIIDVIIPALNEEQAVSGVVERISKERIRDIIVVDNGSDDGTAERARQAGAEVVSEPRRGYGNACLAGLAHLRPGCDIVVFLDADGSDDTDALDDLLAPIIAGDIDIMVGSRSRGRAEAGALSPQQRVGNSIAATWLRWRFGMPATDIGPFRAIRRTALTGLVMRDQNYGWTIEMQIKAAQQGLRYGEIPVNYFRRSVGASKVSGTIRGTLGASVKILGWLAVYDLGRYLPKSLRPKV